AKLAAGVISAEALSDESITGAKLAKGAVSTETLSDGSVTSAKLAPGSVKAEHLASDVFGVTSVGQRLESEQLQDGSICAAKLDFTPIRSTAKQTAVQQFGLAAYNFAGQGELLDCTITFDEPFSNANYVFVATTDQTSCYAVIKAKTPEAVQVTIIRTRISPEPKGLINWIAIGTN
ncbi:WIAG-tail domain, partial [Paenibacillus solisilvae]